MKREIKFRALRRDRSSWVYGDLNQNDIHHGVSIRTNGCIITGVVPESVGQYTGLKDKNGVGIYEGDILNIGTVVFERGTFGVYPEYTDEFVPVAEWSSESRQIIGNIHEPKH